jgi:hypothetical protein
MHGTGGSRSKLEMKRCKGPCFLFYFLKAWHLNKDVPAQLGFERAEDDGSIHDAYPIKQLEIRTATHSLLSVNESPPKGNVELSFPPSSSLSPTVGYSGYQSQIPSDTVLIRFAPRFY